MHRRQLARRSFVVAVTASLVSVAFARHTRATSASLRDFIHDRYTQRDSAARDNRYSYADNNPINTTDPSGH